MSINFAVAVFTIILRGCFDKFFYSAPVVSTAVLPITTPTCIFLSGTCYWIYRKLRNRQRLHVRVIKNKQKRDKIIDGRLHNKKEKNRSSRSSRSLSNLREDHAPADWWSRKFRYSRSRTRSRSRTTDETTKSDQTNNKDDTSTYSISSKSSKNESVKDKKERSLSICTIKSSNNSTDKLDRRSESHYDRPYGDCNWKETKGGKHHQQHERRRRRTTTRKTRSGKIYSFVV